MKIHLIYKNQWKLFYIYTFYHLALFHLIKVKYKSF